MIKAEIQTPTLDDRGFSLLDGPEEFVVLRFWSTHCPACVAGLPTLQRLAEEMTDDPNTAFYSVIIPGTGGEMNVQTFADWHAGQGFTFPVAFDEDGSLHRYFEVRAVPSTVVFHRPSVQHILTPGAANVSWIQSQFSGFFDDN